MKKFLLLLVAIFSIFVLPTTGNPTDVESTNEIEAQKDLFGRKGLSKSIFNVVSFPNNACDAGNGRNGTCYAKSECDAREGSASGTCANGYGVCCLIQLSCGKSSSENNTYIVLASTTTPPASCIYTICPCSTDVCRIRFDFTTFDINGPETALDPGSNGDCNVDYFTVNSPGNRGSPPICGFNTGQHMYIDSSSACSKVAFSSTRASSVTRQYNIKVTQYICGDEMAGPQDCLQYFTSNTGTIKGFNYPAASTTTSTAHLSNQAYDICFRRNFGKCSICYNLSTVMGVNGATKNSFGLSVESPQAESSCTSDYLVIPNGVDPAILGGGFPTAAYVSRFCGPNFVANPSGTICSGVRPFRVTVRTDSDELGNGELPPAGIFPRSNLGFSLDYTQQSC